MSIKKKTAQEIMTTPNSEDNHLLVVYLVPQNRHAASKVSSQWNSHAQLPHQWSFECF
jgi:hypothetical protein